MFMLFGRLIVPAVMLRSNMVKINMIGRIPEDMAGLVHLENLRFYDNPGLIGSIPAGISSLTTLTSLYFVSCGVTGTIPTSVSQMTQLTQLGLYVNRLSGTIPKELAKLTRLRYLGLDRNQFTGVVPNLPFKNYTSYCNLQANA